MKKITTLFLYLVVSLPLFAQNNNILILNFSSGEAKISKEHISHLNHLVDSLNNVKASFKLEVIAHTDDQGDEDYNKQLSKRRGLNVIEHLLHYGISDSLIKLRFYGESSPIAKNSTKNGKGKNRRVEIKTLTIKMPIIKTKQSIWELYEKTSISTQSFKISTQKDTAITCIGGTVIYIKAKSFAINGRLFKGKTVNLKVKEVLTRSDAILENLTTTSNDQILETGGMVNVQAEYGRKPLQLLAGKDLVIMIPKINNLTNAQVFEGERTPHDSIMNWTVNSNSVLQDYPINDILCCSEFLCRFERINSCPFFFCRIQKFITDLFESKKEKAARLTTTDSLNNRCKYLAELFKKYNVNSIDPLIDAINKPLYEKYAVDNVYDLRIAIENEKTETIEANYNSGNIAFEDLKYYVFNSSNLGWENIDMYLDTQDWELTTLKVKLKPDVNTDVKLVFKNINTVLAASKNSYKYTFKDIPKGEEVWIVALKYDEGKPLLALHEVTIGEQKTFEIDFKELTLSELKAEIKRIDPLRQ